MKTFKDFSINLGILAIAFFLVIWFGLGVVVGLRMGEQIREIEPVQAAVELTATQQPEETAATIPTPQPAVVETRQARIITWMYHLDEYGHAIWRQVGEIPAGALVKQGACWDDGYAQVEYRDPERTNWWKVEYVQCP